MTFSYDLSSGEDLDRVRFHTSDTDSSAPIHSNEELLALIEEKGSWQKATVAAFQSIIRKLARAAKVKQDWLEVDNATGMTNFRLMLDEFRAEYADELGLSGDGVSFAAEGVPVYRSDSGATGVSYE